LADQLADQRVRPELHIVQAVAALELLLKDMLAEVEQVLAATAPQCLLVGLLTAQSQIMTGKAATAE
jgi:hypothetical protein